MRAARLLQGRTNLSVEEVPDLELRPAAIAVAICSRCFNVAVAVDPVTDAEAAHIVGDALDGTDRVHAWRERARRRLGTQVFNLL